MTKSTYIRTWLYCLSWIYLLWEVLWGHLLFPRPQRNQMYLWFLTFTWCMLIFYSFIPTFYIFTYSTSGRVEGCWLSQHRLSRAVKHMHTNSHLQAICSLQFTWPAFLWLVRGNCAICRKRHTALPLPLCHFVSLVLNRSFGPTITISNRLQE